MFKTGDKIVCINNLDSYYPFTIGKEYTVINSSNVFDTVYILSDNNIKYNINIFRFKSANEIRKQKDYQYLCDRFILLKDYRKQKLEKLCLKLEIK
jgi:hypothetical protein